MQLPPTDRLRQPPGAAVEGQGAREQHMEQHSRRPNVHRFAVLPPLDDLRRHKVGTTHPTCKISGARSLGGLPSLHEPTGESVGSSETTPSLEAAHKLSTYCHMREGTHVLWISLKLVCGSSTMSK